MDWLPMEPRNGLCEASKQSDTRTAGARHRHCQHVVTVQAVEMTAIRRLSASEQSGEETSTTLMQHVLLLSVNCYCACR